MTASDTTASDTQSYTYEFIDDLQTRMPPEHSDTIIADLNSFMSLHSLTLWDAKQIAATDTLQHYTGTGMLLNTACQVETYIQADAQAQFTILLAVPDPTVLPADPESSEASVPHPPQFIDYFPMMPGATFDAGVGFFFLGHMAPDQPVLIFTAVTQQSHKPALFAALQTLGLWKGLASPPATSELAYPAWSNLQVVGKFPATLPAPLQPIFTFLDLSTEKLHLRADIEQPMQRHEDAFSALALPQLVLRLPLASKSFGSGGHNLAEAFFVIRSPLTYGTSSSYVGAEGKLTIQDGTRNYSIDVEIDFPLDDDLITARGQFISEQTPFIDAANALPGMAGLTQAAPRVDIELLLSFSLAAKRLTAVSFELEFDDWVLIEDLITLKQLQIGFTVLDPLTTRTVGASLFARTRLGGDEHAVDLLCGGMLPGGDFFLQLDTTTPKKLADMLSLLQISYDPTHIPDIAIDDLGVSYNLHSERFEALIEVGGEWGILATPQFTLTDLLFVVGRQPAVDTTPATYFLELDAAMLIGKTQCAVAARYISGAAGGWSLSASAQNIALGSLIEDIATVFKHNLTLPAPLHRLTISSLSVQFSTQAKATTFSFVCDGRLPIHANLALEVRVTIDLTHQGDGTFSNAVTGQLLIDAYTFELHLQQTEHATLLAATYQHQGTAQPLHVKQLLLAIADSAFIRDDLPDLTIDLQELLFVYAAGTATSSTSAAASDTSGARLLFGLDIAADIKLSDLPLIGQKLPADQHVGIENLKIVYATTNFTAAEVAAINSLLPAGVRKLPDAPASAQPTGGAASNQPPAPLLPAGVNFSARLNLGISATTLSMPVLPPPASSGPAASTRAVVPAAQPDSDTTWLAVQKTFGPIDIEKVGVRYHNGELWFLLSAALSAAGLTVSLDGLGVGSALKPFAPRFSLRGLGVDYQSDSLEIGGALLRRPAQNPGEADEYDGMVVIKTEALSLVALGAYSTYQGHPSLFIYAVLDYPLGGPAFFFVTGLAAGFGYNRDLLIPPIGEIAQFPLVAEAIAPSQKLVPNTTAPAAASEKPDGKAAIERISNTLTAELEMLRRYVPPAPVNFLAVGIRFSSFKTIDSFALLTLTFGQRFELNLLGISTLIAPVPEAGKAVSPLAEVQLVLKASFIPAEGFLGVQAQLTPNSYILSRACTLTGGFAFFTWYKDNPRHDPSDYQAGDFVLTVGGYHPLFTVPKYYPTVPRLGFNWRVNDHLGIKGDAYFALTGHAFMAGGHLEAVWESDAVKAWFKVGADFIVSWKPYYYDASMYVDIGAALTIHFFGTHHVTIDIGADLHLWGPDFSGKAKLHYWIISCSVSFGAHAKAPPPITWATFRSSFLPADETITGITVKSGLLTHDSQDDNYLGAINATELCLVTNSLVPITNLLASNTTNNTEQPLAATQPQPFGIAPMAVTHTDLTSRHVVSITRDGQSVVADFQCTPITKHVPAGLWGASATTDYSQQGRLEHLNSAPMVANTWAGLEISPAQPPVAGHSSAIDRRRLQYETTTVADAYDWETPPALLADASDEAQRRALTQQSLGDPATHDRRNGLLAALGMPPAAAPDAALVAALLFAPRLEAPQT